MTGLFFCLLLTAAAGNGCKEGCDGVVCAPAPPALVVTVEDTLAVIDTVTRYDTTLMDSVRVPDTTITTVPTFEATVTLHPVSGDAVQSSVRTLDPVSVDTTYVLTDPSGLAHTDYALIARRGDRADTLTGLTIRTVEGCCGYDVIGVYTMKLPE